MWRRVAPSARRSPISERRSSTEITITLAIPTPPTSRATAPRPRNSAVNALLAAARAASASLGRLTSTSSGCSGLAVAPSRSRGLLDLVLVGAHVDRRGRAVRAEQALGDVEADQRGAVEVRRRASPGPGCRRP